jgi:hypothetical protein
MSTIEERIAILALDTFDGLPAKSKPRIHPGGSREWVPMSAIILALGTSSRQKLREGCNKLTAHRVDPNTEHEQLTCVSLACAP